MLWIEGVGIFYTTKYRGYNVGTLVFLKKKGHLGVPLAGRASYRLHYRCGIFVPAVKTPGSENTNTHHCRSGCFLPASLTQFGCKSIPLPVEYTSSFFF
jgi:hypothetical protein